MSNLDTLLASPSASLGRTLPVDLVVADSPAVGDWVVTHSRGCYRRVLVTKVGPKRVEVQYVTPGGIDEAHRIADMYAAIDPDRKARDAAAAARRDFAYYTECATLTAAERGLPAWRHQYEDEHRANAQAWLAAHPDVEAYAAERAAAARADIVDHQARPWTSFVSVTTKSVSRGAVFAPAPGNAERAAIVAVAETVRDFPSPSGERGIDRATRREFTLFVDEQPVETSTDPDDLAAYGSRLADAARSDGHYPDVVIRPVIVNPAPRTGVTEEPSMPAPHRHYARPATADEVTAALTAFGTVTVATDTLRPYSAPVGCGRGFHVGLSRVEDCPTCTAPANARLAVARVFDAVGRIAYLVGRYGIDHRPIDGYSRLHRESVSGLDLVVGARADVADTEPVSADALHEAAHLAAEGFRGDLASTTRFRGVPQSATLRALADTADLVFTLAGRYMDLPSYADGTHARVVGL